MLMDVRHNTSDCHGQMSCPALFCELLLSKKGSVLAYVVEADFGGSAACLLIVEGTNAHHPALLTTLN
jgi:hypothetical protein